MSTPNLRAISDDTLTGRLCALVRREREMMFDVLHHLNEVERRRLHLRHGYRSMFAYCTGHLKYSESAAGRRILTARVIRRYPRVADLISSGDINLSTISKVARIALSRNDAALFERIRGKSQDEATAIAAEYCPRTRPRDCIRPVSVREATRTASVSTPVPLAAAAPRCPSSPPLRGQESSKHSRSGSAATAATEAISPATATRREGAEATPRTTLGQQTATEVALAAGQQATSEAPLATTVEQHYVVQFVAGADLMRAIAQVRSLLSFRLPANSSMESVLAVVLDEFIERHSPDRRRERRKVKGAAREDHKSTPEPAPSPRLRHKTPEAAAMPRSRYIPAAVRDEVFVRDDCRCSYVGRDGIRCAATRYLQIDHIVPIARGGGNDPDNLRVLCGAHNRLEAERLLGAATMTPFTRRE